jgi:hypothetical protein
MSARPGRTGQLPAEKKVTVSDHPPPKWIVWSSSARRRSQGWGHGLLNACHQILSCKKNDSPSSSGWVDFGDRIPTGEQFNFGKAKRFGSKVCCWQGKQHQQHRDSEKMIRRLLALSISPWSQAGQAQRYPCRPWTVESGPCCPSFTTPNKYTVCCLPHVNITTDSWFRTMVNFRG